MTYKSLLEEQHAINAALEVELQPTPTHTKRRKIPWSLERACFSSQNNDSIPDRDNGDFGMSTLQLMLMQCDRKRIQLLPAWPRDWTVDFKLHAPYKTTVEGHAKDGKVIDIKVVPADGLKDVIVIPPSA